MNGFIPKFYRDGQVDAYKYLPCAAAAYKIGQPLKVASGVLTAATGTDRVSYISMHEGTLAQGEVLACIPVSKETEYEVVLTASVASLANGSTCKLSADGMSLAAAGSGDTANVTVLETTGAAAGDRALVQFV